MTGKLRVGILGAGRGVYLGGLFAAHPRVQVVALCDQDLPRLEAAARRFSGVSCYQQFAALLEHPLDVVVVANDAPDHAPCAIQALEAGRHVLSEVVACQTMAEAVALVRAVERAAGMYTLAENCCYMAPVLEMKRLYQEGAIGELLYAEGEYMHDCSRAWPALTYGDPGHWRNWAPATFYCTHSLGPLLDVTGLRPVSCAGYTTPNRLGRQIGRRGDDVGMVVCRLENGALAKVLMGFAIRREPATHWYSLYGTRGHAENQRGAEEDRVHVYLADEAGQGAVQSYQPAVPPPEWAAGDGGHGGADALLVDAFLTALWQGGQPPLDVYRGLEMTLPGLLGFRSACQGGAPLEVPDLRLETERERYAQDNWSADPRHGAQAPSSAHGAVELSPDLYAEQARRYRPV